MKRQLHKQSLYIYVDVIIMYKDVICYNNSIKEREQSYIETNFYMLLKLSWYGSELDCSKLRIMIKAICDKMDYGEIWAQVRLKKISIESGPSSWLSDSQDELLVANLEIEGYVYLVYIKFKEYMS